MWICANIKFLTRLIHDISQCVHGGKFVCLLNQVKEQIFLHYISIHEDVSVLSIPKVWLHGENTFLFVDVQCLTVGEMILRIVNRVIHQSDVCT